MTKFKVGDKGTYRNGQQHDQIEVLSKSANFYYVKSVTDGTVYQIWHSDFDEHFSMGFGHTPRPDSCTCGAAKVGHPGHSYWCDARRYS